MTTQRDFTRLFEVLRGERQSELDNETFVQLSESLYALALARLLPPHERYNMVKTASASLRGQVQSIEGAAPFPRAAIQ
jgi:hypothetical protein